MESNKAENQKMNDITDKGFINKANSGYSTNEIVFDGTIVSDGKRSYFSDDPNLLMQNDGNGGDQNQSISVLLQKEINNSTLGNSENAPDPQTNDVNNDKTVTSPDENPVVDANYRSVNVLHNNLPIILNQCPHTEQHNVSVVSHNLSSVKDPNQISLTVFENGLSVGLDQNGATEAHERTSDEVFPSSMCNALICSFCSKKIYNHQNLRNHLLQVHRLKLPEKLYSCSYCKETFKYIPKLRAHYKKVHQHPDDLSEVCDQNAETASLKSTSTTQVKNFTCPYCKRGFKNKYWLQTHCKKFHQDPNVCSTVDDQNGNEGHESTSRTFCNEDGSLLDSQRSSDEMALSMYNELICSYCSKKISSLRLLKRHLWKLHKSKLLRNYNPCSYCKQVFKLPSELKAHISKLHEQPEYMDTSWINENRNLARNDHGKIKCVECNIKCGNLRVLRDHLTKHHNLNMDEKEISFPNMIAFKKWKLDLERRERTFFYAVNGIQKGSKCNRCLYRCHRSGNYEFIDRKRTIGNVLGSKKTGIVCTASITIAEYPEEVQVKYCLQHYGHGQKTNILQLSVEEQAAINENVSKGISLQEQLDDIKHAQSLAEHFQAKTIKIRDVNFINSAYASEIYNAGMSPLEYVEQWVRACSEMENSPILLYRPEEAGVNDEDSMLIIMTEFQKHILMSCTKEVICLDSHRRVKKGNDFLTVLIVMDENDVAFPVAFCISCKVDKCTMLEFLSSVKESTGPLSFTYFMSDKDKIYYEAWQEIMQDESIWIWSIWSFDNSIRRYLFRMVKDIPTREATYRLLRTLMECNNQDVFATMLRNFKDSCLDNVLSKEFGKLFELQYGSNQGMWACCYRKNLKYSTNFYHEYMHKTLQHFFRKSRTKQLDKLLMVLMKYLRFKMIDRLSNMLDEERISLAKKSITMCHSMGLDIDCGNITSLSDNKIWLIRSEDEVDAYVTREYVSCPELCDLRCPDCDVCVHMYSCTCVHSIINANMCKHIHAVVWKLLTPHFSLPPSPAPDPCDNDDIADDIPNNDVAIPDYDAADILKFVLKRMQSVYKQVRINKCQLNKNSLSTVLKLLDRCYQICSNDGTASDLVSKSTQTEMVPEIPPVHTLNDLVHAALNCNSENIPPIDVAPSSKQYAIAETAFNSSEAPGKSNTLTGTSSRFVALRDSANPSIIMIPSNSGHTSSGNTLWKTRTVKAVASSNPMLNALVNSISGSSARQNRIVAIPHSLASTLINSTSNTSERQKQVATIIPSALSNPVINTTVNSSSNSSEHIATVLPAARQKQVASIIPASILKPILNVLNNAMSSAEKNKAVSITLDATQSADTNTLSASEGSQKRTFMHISPPCSTPKSKKKCIAKECHLKRIHFVEADSEDDSSSQMTNSTLVEKTAVAPSSDSSTTSLQKRTLMHVSPPCSTPKFKKKCIAKECHFKRIHFVDADSEDDSSSQMTNTTLVEKTAVAPLSDSSSTSLHKKSDYASLAPSVVEATSALASVSRNFSGPSQTSVTAKPVSLTMSDDSLDAMILANDSDETDEETSDPSENKFESDTPCVISSYHSLRSDLETTDLDAIAENFGTSKMFDRRRCVICYSPGPSLFKIPREENRYKQWFSALKWKVSPQNVSYVLNNAKLCSKHFPDNCFTSTLRCRLTKFACPAIT